MRLMAQRAGGSQSPRPFYRKLNSLPAPVLAPKGLKNGGPEFVIYMYCAVLAPLPYFVEKLDGQLESSMCLGLRGIREIDIGAMFDDFGRVVMLLQNNRKK